jgi:hypothetical protein
MKAACITAIVAASAQAVMGFAPSAPAAHRSGVLALRAQSENISRRGMIATFSAGVLALPQLAAAEKARTGLSSKFTGEYSDPMHPGCKRSIKVTGNAMDSAGRKSRKPAAVIKGTDNEDGGACENGEGESWRLMATLSEDQSTIKVDFSPKGGPKDVVGKWSDNGIVFPDGNKWSKVETEVTTLVGKIGK